MLAEGEMADGNRTLSALLNNVTRVLIGKRSEVELALIALASEGHILIEDVPGVGKTMLAKSLAKSRSEEHTSELQSRENLVCRLLLEKKNVRGFVLCHNFSAAHD